MTGGTQPSRGGLSFEDLIALAAIFILVVLAAAVYSAL